MFKKASKEKLKARIALYGPAGGGKTYTALQLAKGLGDKIALVDTESHSAALYSDVVEFDTAQLDDFNPRNYINAIKAAEAAGYDVLVIDSLSHAWNGQGGALEIMERAAERLKGNSYMAWKDVTPLQNEMIDTIIRSTMHIIVTMRSKTEYVVEQRNGKSVPRKVGLAPVQRDGLEYEFTVVGEMDYDHNMVITKSRFAPWDGKTLEKPTAATVEPFLTWLNSGSEPAKPKPVISENWRDRDRDGRLFILRDAFKAAFPASSAADIRLIMQGYMGVESAQGLTDDHLADIMATLENKTAAEVAQTINSKE